MAYNLFMLSSTHRLRSSEVEEVFLKGRRLGTPLLSFVSLSPVDRAAFAVVVTKKVARSAVDRNKIRRRVYSILSKVKNYHTKVHGVFLPKKETKNISFAVLEKEIENILIRANIIK